jgi:two-component system response regulator YesN
VRSDRRRGIRPTPIRSSVWTRPSTRLTTSISSPSLIAGTAGGQADRDQDRIERICEYIRQHFSEEISTQMLAKEFSINANYLSTLFRTRTGVTVTGYIQDVRMNAACRLLSETTMSVSEVAESVGYFDPKYFYRVFKRAKGFTPGEIRSGFRGRPEKSAPLN